MATTTPKLKSMKRSAADRRADAGEPAPMGAINPDYPYGLLINLDKDELDKAGFKKLPEVGAVLTLYATVKVTRVNQSAVDGVDDENSVSLQITDLTFE